MQISQLDLVIIVLYFVVIVVIAVVSSRGIHGTSDFFLAGRSMRWPFIGASLFATNISAEQFVGQAGLAFVVGMAVANYQLAGVVAFIAMGALFLPIYMKLGLYTTPEFLEKRYGPESRRFFSFLTLMGMAFAGIPGSLYAGGRVTEVLFGFDSIVPGVIGLALAAGSYAMLGGLRTVIVTDFIQCTLLVLGGSLMLFTGLHVLGGWEQFQVSMQDLQPADSWDMFSLIQPLDHPHVPWTGVILGLTIHALSFGATSHVMIQRALAARSVHEARMGGLMAGLLKIIAVFIILVPGLIGYVMASGSNPLIEVRSPDQMFPALASYLLPTGLVGLTLAGLIAALMSSVDSEICAASGLFAMDWYKPLRPESSQRRLVWAGRIMGFALMLVGIVWAIVVIPEFRFLYEYLAKFASYLPGTTVACFLWGLVSKYPTRRAAFATLITGSLLGIFMWAATDSEVVNRLVCSDDGLGLAFLEMHFLHAAFALFATASLLLFGLSYFLPDEAGAKTLAEHDVDESLMPTKEQDQIYWVSVGALVVLFVCMYWYF
jgi:SSS family solute:Na+ symporter